MGRKWQAVSVRARTLFGLVGELAPRVSFIKLDIEGSEHKNKIVADIVKNFTHPRLCVALEAKEPHIRRSVQPFDEAGFSAYNLKNDYRWLFEDKPKSRW
jgi:hypothetical protein